MKATAAEQAAFLRTHIDEVREQTAYARDHATTVHDQITADRYLRALTATRMLVDLMESESADSLVNAHPVWPAVAELLGFETD